MIQAWKVYFKAAWFFRTPIVFLMDKRYEMTTKELMKRFYDQMPSLKYIPEIRDCDNFSFIYKGIADRTTNAVGLIVGWTSVLHVWNMALTKQGIQQIEPQTGKIFTKKKGYHAFIVII